MQVQSRVPSALYHGHPSKDQSEIRTNGNHSDCSPDYSSSPNGYAAADDMHPYHRQSHPQYAGGQPAPQHPQYANTNQLAPMQYRGLHAPQMPEDAQGAPIPGPSNSVMYPPVQPPAQSVQQRRQEPLSSKSSNGKYTFELVCEQQPQRARMCGFGDKDRRPITPPPCVRLVITDDATGKTVEPDQIDGSFLVLQVNLWDDNATREVDSVRSSSTSPAVSISTATTTSYPPTPDRPPPPPEYPVIYTADGQAMMQRPQTYPHPSMHPGLTGYPGQIYYHQQQLGPVNYPMNGPHSAHSDHTRNLIGSVSVNASVLKDTTGKKSYWFVLQDMSVRTEGWFRLKMYLWDLACPKGGGVTHGRAPTLSHVYSDKFQVYSAKKFPGVIESTELSKCFAAQGVKIPIRKDIKSERDDDDE